MRFAKTLPIVAWIVLVAAPAWGDPAPNEILKFQQLPLNGPLAGAPAGVGSYYGHDELSTAVSVPGAAPGTYAGVAMADDFADVPVPGLSAQPVVHVRWWGSYLNNDVIQPVDKFLIAFESDLSAADNPAGFSQPQDVLLSQVVTRTPAASYPVPPGTFTEKSLSPGGPPLGEGLYEYNAELHVDKWFDEKPDTVYWLKIVALVDGDPTGGPATRWGWHDRDWSAPDPLASTPPLVSPGEHIEGSVLSPGGVDIPVWHFQDDAVTSQVNIVPNDADPWSPHVSQAGYQPQRYVYSVTDATGNLLEGIDGPPGIEKNSKDLAFELYTVPEPASLLLLLAGGGALALRRRRRAR